jgi:hypothetical protein
MKLKGPVVILILVMMLLFSSNAVCQVRIGVIAGPDVNFLDSRKFNSPINIPGRLYGYCTGANVGYDLNERISLLTGVMLIQKDYSIRRKDSVDTRFFFKNTFIQIPLQAQLKVFDVKKWNLGISGGGFVSYWGSSHVEGIIPNAFDHYVDGQSNVHVNWVRVNTSNQFTRVDVRYEYGIAGGMSLSYEMSSRLAITSSGSFYRSLTDLRSDNSPRRLNNTFVVGFGAWYEIKAK